MQKISAYLFMLLERLFIYKKLNQLNYLNKI